MKLSVFNFAISSISATRTVGGMALQGALGITADLPASLHPLLRQPVISSDDLAPFEKLRKRAQEFLRRNGAYHELIGWVTDDSSASRGQIVDFMEATASEFYAEKTALLSSYEERREDHLEKIRKECEEAGFQHCGLLLDLIQQAQPRLEYLEKAVQFTWLRPRVVEIHPDEENAVLTGLYGQALAEIASRAKKAATAPRCATLIKAASEIGEKCLSLAYLDPRYQRVAKEIATVLDEIPDREKDSDFHTGERLALMGMLSILSDADALDEKIKSGGSLFPAMQPEPEEAEETVEEEGEEPESGPESAPPPAGSMPESRVYAW